MWTSALHGWFDACYLVAALPVRWEKLIILSSFTDRENKDQNEKTASQVNKETNNDQNIEILNWFEACQAAVPPMVNEWLHQQIRSS